MIIALAALVAATTAHAQDMIEITTPAERALVVIVNPERQWEDTRFGLYLQAGNFVGARGQWTPWSSENVSLQLEAFYGGAITSSGWGNTVGGGVRVSFTPLNDGENDALRVSPGVDFYFMKGDSERNGFINFSPYSNIYFVAASADIAWVHQFSRNIGIEVGARLGAAVAFYGERTPDTSTAGTVSPELGIYSGVRF